MNEIKEGMFIRTDDGKINKFKRYITDKKRVCETDMYARLAVDNIVKASFDIIDLIKVGDYVNGGEVIEIYEKGRKYENSTYVFKQKAIEVANDNYETIPMDCLFTNDEIESVVTKEQFESMSYRIGG